MLRHTVPLLALAVAMVVGSSGAAFAIPMCSGDSPGVSITFGFSVGGEYTEDEQATFDLMRLRRAGVDATRVERWNGCLRAFVRNGRGGEVMEFYDPRTLEQVF